MGFFERFNFRFNFNFTPTSRKGVYESSLEQLWKEMDQIPWHINFLASLANWSMLAGFIVLPSAFDDDDSKFRLNQTTLRGCAVALVVLGYILTGLLCWQYKNVLFQLEAIFMPGFMSSALGLMSSLFNVYGKKYSPPDEMWSSTSITAVALSGVFMVLYGTTAMSASRMVKKIRTYDEAVEKLQKNAYEDETRISEDELVRRRMLTLLLGGAPHGGCVCGGHGGHGGSGSNTNLNAGVQVQAVVDGEGVGFPMRVQAVYDPERSERERRRAEVERAATEREAARLQEEEASGSGLGLPAALRRPSAGIEMRANIGRVGSLGMEEQWLEHHHAT